MSVIGPTEFETMTQLCDEIKNLKFESQALHAEFADRLLLLASHHMKVAEGVSMRPVDNTQR